MENYTGQMTQQINYKGRKKRREHFWLRKNGYIVLSFLPLEGEGGGARAGGCLLSTLPGPRLGWGTGLGGGGGSRARGDADHLSSPLSPIKINKREKMGIDIVHIVLFPFINCKISRDI